MTFLPRKTSTLLFALGIGIASAAAAQDASELGKSLTPMGAEKAGNADGSIPAWDGGLTKVPAGFTPGGYYPDPYADDKPLFTITPADVDKYKDHLTPGQLAMFKKYADYRMIVYPTHRSAAFPKANYQETMVNAASGRAKLVSGGDGLTGTNGGVAFPIPKSGNEAIWNLFTRYRGESYITNNTQVSVTRTGDYTPVRFEYKIDYSYGSLKKKVSERSENLLFYFLQTITAPARLAGSVLLVHEPLDQVKEQRSAWTYNPGQRRVRQAPNVSYDNPGTAADGLRTNDDFALFNGATDRYNWTLVGKKDIYIPYNSYKLTSDAFKLKDLVKPGHLNPDALRYELHRVWVIDAKLKPGTSHIYARRTIYLDEDSWAPVLVDKYDGRGELWRFSEGHSIELYDVPFLYSTIEVHHDLQSARYVALNLANDDKEVYVPAKLSASDFTPSSLRDLGTR